MKNILRLLCITTMILSFQMVVWADYEIDPKGEIIRIFDSEEAVVQESTQSSLDIYGYLSYIANIDDWEEPEIIAQNLGSYVYNGDDGISSYYNQGISLEVCGVFHDIDTNEKRKYNTQAGEITQILNEWSFEIYFSLPWSLHMYTKTAVLPKFESGLILEDFSNMVGAEEAWVETDYSNGHHTNGSNKSYVYYVCSTGMYTYRFEIEDSNVQELLQAGAELDAYDMLNKMGV